MRRPPRKVGARLLDRRLVVVSILQGTGLLLATLAVFHWSFAQGETEPAARALAFVALVAGNVGLILVNRSWRDSALRMMGARNVAAWWMIVGATATLVAALALPFLRAIFRFDLPEPRHIAIAAGAGLLSLAWFEAAKLVWRLRRPGVREGR